MRRTSLTLLALILSVNTVRADDSMPRSVVDAVKAAAVFVKVKTEGGGCSGSGFVVKTDKEAAYIVTNHHVIEPKLVEMLLVPDVRSPGPRRSLGPHHSPSRPSASLLPPGYTPHYIVHSFKNAAVTVVFSSGTTNERAVKAEVLSADPERDLALLKVSGAAKYPEPIDYLHELELTETMPVCTFGFPFGEMLAMAKGNPAITVGKASISSLRRDETGELALVQIDGALNPGNSGGPMVDIQGRLVGVAVATIRNSNGIGLAIPAKEVSRMMQGRLGKVYVHASRDDNGAMTLHVEAALIDPFHKIKSVALHYLDASHMADKPNPNEPLKAISGCRTLPLKIEDQSAVGQVTLKRGVSEVTILHQAVCVNGSGERVVANSVVETVKPDGDAVTVQLDKEPSGDRPVAEADSPKSEEPSSPRPGPKSTSTARPGPHRLTEDDLASILDELKAGKTIPAMLSLDRINPQQAHPDVARALEREMLEDGQTYLRSHAARLLKTWGTPQSIPALKKAARDADPYVRDCAKAAIEKINEAAEEHSTDAPKPNAFTNDTESSSPKKREASDTKQIDDLDILLADLKSHELGRRMHALLQLKESKPREPHPEVAKALETVLLEDGNVNMRVLACLALKKWGTAENLPALKKALDDRETGVRTWAKASIKAIESDTEK